MSGAVFNFSALYNHSSGSGSLACNESQGAFVFLYMVQVFDLVVGFPINMMVMCQVAKKKSNSSTSDIFIFNLAIADAYFCLMAPIDLVNRLLLRNKHIWSFIISTYGLKDTTPLLLTCICLDRYMAVVHPIVFSSTRDNKIRVAISILVWGLMLAGALSKSLAGWDSTINIFIGLIWAVFAIMVFCNISIIWTLRKSVIGKEKMHPVKKKALKMVVFTLAIIFFCYLPPVAIFPFAEYYSILDFDCPITVVVFSFMNLSSSIEPLLYISKMDQCTVTLPCSCCQRPSNKS